MHLPIYAFINHIMKKGIVMVEPERLRAFNKQTPIHIYDGLLS